jgi:thiamine kinase-like enzyme
MNVRQVPDDRYELALKMGATLTPPDLVKLLRTESAADHRFAPIHGDLHHGNVQVRGSDAILIDFRSVRHGPIVADPAALEVSLAFAVDDGDETKWRELVDILYSPQYLSKQPPPPANRPSDREWLWSMVRQIRMLALAEQDYQGEYLSAVTTYLLRHATFPSVSERDNRHRAHCYVLACRLAKS